jgi:hypothetical protein
MYVNSEAQNPPDCRLGLRGSILDDVTNISLQVKETLHEAIHTLNTSIKRQLIQKQLLWMNRQKKVLFVSYK